MDGIVWELVTIMNGYVLNNHFLDYVFRKVTGITIELNAFIHVGQAISMLLRTTLPRFIENIRKELAATGKSLPFVTSESGHGVVEARLGEDEVFRFSIECSLATNQMENLRMRSRQKSRFAKLSNNLVALKGKNLTFPLREKVSLRIGSSSVPVEQEPWNPSSLTPAKELLNVNDLHFLVKF